LFRMNENIADLVEQFYLPFGGKLNPANRWVQLSKRIPWDKVEQKYVEAFKSPVKGKQAYSVRVALGALIIKERLGLSDRETTLQIAENPYLQFFIGYSEFVDKEPFHHSLMTHFRQRLGPDIMLEINEWIVAEAIQAEEAQAIASDQASDDDDDDSGDGQIAMGVSDELTLPEELPTRRPKQKTKRVPSQAVSTDTDAEPPTHKGKLMLDATCAPADIKYPTDLGLLNHARKITEDIIDTLHEPHIGLKKKPRTYRNQARKAYLSVIKQRKTSGKAQRKAIRKQLSYVRRNLKTIEKQVVDTPLTMLSHRQYRRLLVVNELYRQQWEMFQQKQHRIDDRIVNIDQPHVRPIVRGKAGAQVEFGAKIAASLIDGYVHIENMQWDNFNEAKTLQASVESYKQRFGYYPKAVLADKLYRNRENLKYCRERGIRLSGPKLGRPPKGGREADKKQERQDTADRNQIEGKFGEGKRKFGLDRIRARLANTSETVIAVQFIVMNLERRLRFLFFLLMRWFRYRNLHLVQC